MLAGHEKEHTVVKGGSPVAGSINSLWQSICSSLKDRVPKKTLLSRGVTETQIRKVERSLGHELPDDVREFYGIQNGIPGIEITLDVNIGFCLPLVPLKIRPVALGASTVCETWSHFKKRPACIDLPVEWIKPKGPIAKVAWTPEWIPIFDNIQGDYVFLDLNPPKRGSRGQLIDWWRGDGPKRILFRSFRQFLARIASGLAANQFVVETENSSAALILKSTWKKRQLREQND